ncbi:MAG: DinB family protein [Candidatus Dormibacteria bacterium]
MVRNSSGDVVDLGLDEHGRPEPPPAADETTTILAFLEYHRATFAWKCGGLDADGLNRRTAASTMTLGGMMKHLALVEDGWFSRSLHGRDYSPPWDEIDWESDPDWEWRTAAGDRPEELLAIWEQAVARSRERVTEALADGGLDHVAVRAWPDGRAPTLRWILLHMIEEYARHNGHADLLREVADGETGE